jgi:hypothetical protein
MPLHSPSLRRFVKRALVDATGVPDPGRAELGRACDILCQRLRDHLLPLFGTTAVDALFARSAHVAAGEFPWLAELGRKGNGSCSIDAFAAHGEIDLDTLLEGLAMMLAHNIGLLSAFLGDDLVLPLVQQAWGVSGASGHEDAQ